MKDRTSGMLACAVAVNKAGPLKTGLKEAPVLGNVTGRRTEHRDASVATGQARTNHPAFTVRKPQAVGVGELELTRRPGSGHQPEGRMAGIGQQEMSNFMRHDDAQCLSELGPLTHRE